MKGHLVFGWSEVKSTTILLSNQNPIKISDLGLWVHPLPKVLTLYGNSEHFARVCNKPDIFNTNFKFATAFDLNKRRKRIKLPISFYSFAPISELPSNKCKCYGYTYLFSIH